MEERVDLTLQDKCKGDGCWAAYSQGYVGMIGALLPSKVINSTLWSSTSHGFEHY